MPRRSKAEEARMEQHELVGFVAGVALCQMADATADLQAAADALEAQAREYGMTPLLSVATKRLFLGIQSIQHASETTRRWQRADQERTGYPEKYRRGP